MQRIVSTIVRDWPSAVVIAAAAGLQLLLVLRPFNFLLTNFLVDDGFYYFGIARNIALGLGSSFDGGLTMTNGYHPLWMLILAALYKWVPSASEFTVEPIYAALFLSILFNVFSAIFVYRVISRFTVNPYIRGLGIAVWSLNPFFLYVTLNGVETSLAMFLFSFFVLLCVRAEEGKPFGGYVLLGLVGGLMTLARLDMIFFVFMFLAWMFMRRSTWGELAKAAVSSGAPVAAYLLWNILNFGSIFTSSSQVETLVNHYLVYQDNGPGLFQTFKAVIFFTQHDAEFMMQQTGMYALAFVFIGAFIALVLRGEVRVPRALREIPVLTYLFAGFVLLYIANVSVRWTAREWYFVSGELFLAIVVVIVTDTLVRRLRSRNAVVAAAILAMLFSFFVVWHQSLQPSKTQFKLQREMYDAAMWMNDHLGSTTRSGAFNSGVIGYFSLHPHINLDALVNNDALVAMQKRELWAYMQDERIEYLSEFPQYLTYRYKNFFGIDDVLSHLTPVQKYPSGLTVYKVK